MSKLLLMYILFFFNPNVMCISLSQEQEIFLINCIKHRKNSLHYTPDEKSKFKRCQRLFKSSSLSKIAVTKEEDPALANSNDEMMKYMAALLRWRTADNRQSSNLLDRVAPCNSHSKLLRKYWKQFFLKRQRTVFSSVEILDQTWNKTNGKITFRPSILRYSPRNIVAAELVITRASPIEIDELYGHYKTRVTLVRKDGAALYRVHSDSQSSCSSRNGDLMLLDLNVNEVSRWHRNRMENVTLSVAVTSHRQYFNSTIQKMDDVVDKIVGVVVHFRRSQSEIERDELEMRQRMLKAVQRLRNKAVISKKGNLDSELPNSNAKNKSLLRKRTRRSPGSRGILIDRPRPSQSREHCHLVSFQIQPNVLRAFVKNLAHSLDYNIHECEGVCQHPFPHHINVTNHAIVTNRISNACCVPIQYKALPYIATRSRQNHVSLIGAEITNMVATKCGCR